MGIESTAMIMVPTDENDVIHLSMMPIQGLDDVSGLKLL
jgi:hypothetical protein